MNFNVITIVAKRLIWYKNSNQKVQKIRKSDQNIQTTRYYVKFEMSKKTYVSNENSYQATSPDTVNGNRSKKLHKRGICVRRHVGSWCANTVRSVPVWRPCPSSKSTQSNSSKDKSDTKVNKCFDFQSTVSAVLRPLQDPNEEWGLLVLSSLAGPLCLKVMLFWSLQI